MCPVNRCRTERNNERETLLKGRLRTALLRLNEWITEEQAERVIFNLEHVDATGMARNRAVHEYLTYGMPMDVDGQGGRRTRSVRFFDFDHPDGGLNEFVVTTQFRVRRGNERSNIDDDERMVIPDLVLFVNGIPLVVMEAKSPSLMDVWKSQAVRQLRRYQEAGSTVARGRRAGVIPLQPAVRRPLWGWRGIRHPWRAGERLLRVEISAALVRGRGEAATWRRAAGAGATNRGPPHARHPAGHPARLRGV